MSVAKQKVFIVTEYIGLNHNSTAYYWAKIAQYFDSTFDLQVICPKNSYTEVFFEETGIKVAYVKGNKFNKNRLLTRVMGQLNYSWSLNRTVVSLVTKDDLVFSGTNPIIGALFMALLKKYKGFKWLVLCHDIFPNNLIPSGVMRPNLLYEFLKKIFKVVYTKPDAIAPIGRDMAKILVDIGVAEDRVHVIPNWADHEKIEVCSKVNNPIIKDLGWENDVVFCYFGNIGRLQGVPMLLEAIRKVKSKNARFLFIGGGAEQDLVGKFVSDSDNYNTYYYGELSLQDNDLGLGSGDVALVTLNKGMFGLGVPSKAYFSMAADKPILLVADEGSELELLLRDYNLGWFCKSGSASLLATKIDEICEQFSRTKVLYSPRATLIENFSEKNSLGQYLKLAEKMFKS
ncbi:glycosyltransferase family 4 protein [Kangiella sp.]|uniref:glycosyltransferase family 4 protein n=1 Tax=Kangiella sp. TaxID=1920245 RepID=UPI0019933773|nr:glycosyltransferase family 4 protein [Kangiella sp.]MBD3652392.1 glycosyltransferase family 4 protein [Kangiella sp.]